MAQDYILDTKIIEHCSRDFSGKSSDLCKESILRAQIYFTGPNFFQLFQINKGGAKDHLRFFNSRNSFGHKRKQSLRFLQRKRMHLPIANNYFSEHKLHYTLSLFYFFPII